jgi:hypothetical protein
VGEHFLVVGDAPDPFRERALEVCEMLGQTFLDHFDEKKFTVAYPDDRRLSVVVLRSPESYAAYQGVPADEVIGGHYDLGVNRLVIFDSRPAGRNEEAAATRVNTFALVHETAHLLSFNTGLLSREADVPLAISEGLATYVELWVPPSRGRSRGRREPIGIINRPRLQALLDARDAEESWIPLATILEDDESFRRVETRQLAYAEAWLLVHNLLKTPSRLAGFRTYLDRLRQARGTRSRLTDLESTLGPLDRLDREVKRYKTRILRG